MIDEQDAISDRAFRALLDWYMASDPFPASDETDDVIYDFLTAQAQRRGFETWTVAFHEFEVLEL